MAPVSAGAVGVPPLGMVAANAFMIALAPPGSSASGTTGVAYEEAVHEAVASESPKNVMPMDMPAAAGETTSDVTAVLIASHLVGWTIGMAGVSHASSACAQFIDADRSWRMNTSVAIGLAS